MTEQQEQRKRQHDEYLKRIQEARERGDRTTEAQLSKNICTWTMLLIKEPSLFLAFI